MNEISPDEKLTRFIYDRDDFKPSTGEVKFSAFMPPKVKTIPPTYKSDLSVCRISERSGNRVLSEDKIWKIGLEDVNRPGRTLRARADLSASDVYQHNLKVIADPQSFKEHANITPFPPDELGCLRLATKLALVCKLEVKPRECT